MPTITEYNPFDAEVKRNPYPYYDWLRLHHPVYHNQRLNLWALSRYQDVVDAARRADLFSSSSGIGPDYRPGFSMISNDPPVHTRLRLLVSSAFTPTAVAQHAYRIQAAVDKLLEPVMARGAFDVVSELAVPLPLIVIGEILGVVADRVEELKRWSGDFLGIASGTPHGHDRGAYQRSLEEFNSYFSSVIAERGREPRDDLISILVKAHQEDGLTMRELLNFCELLLVAGNETASNLIGNIVLALLGHPEERRKLRQQPELGPCLVEEVLRYDSPVQLFFRTTTRDVLVRGTTIPAGAKVALLWGAANRDPEVFPHADRFDLGRNPNPHVGFGYGIHYCLGAPLTRLEARIATATILRRMRRLRPAADSEFERNDNPLLRGLKRLPIIFELEY